MKVWVVEVWQSHEDCEILGVFETKNSVVHGIFKWLDSINAKYAYRKHTLAASTKDADLRLVLEKWEDNIEYWNGFNYPHPVAHFNATGYVVE